MKAKRYLLLVVALTAIDARAAEERVSVDQLPAEVRKTLDARREQARIKEVTRRVVDGKTVYVVEIEKNNAPNPRLRIAEDGTLLRDTTPYVSSSDMPVLAADPVVGAVEPLPRLRLADLPAAVQRTAQIESKGREIADIDMETWKGVPVYEIEFKERGLNSRVYVAEDGGVVRPEKSARGFKNMLLGTQLEDTPAAVQETVRRIAGEREVADIDKKGVGADAIYRVEIRGPRGTQELRVGQDGRVIYDSHDTAERRRGE